MRTTLAAIPFTPPFLFKDALPLTVVDATPGSSLLGLATTLGSKLVGNASNNNQKTDKAGFLVILPDNWMEGSIVALRARVKKDTTLATVLDKVDMTAKLQGDDAVGSDLVTTSPQQVTVAYANYDFSLPGTSLRRGDHLWCQLVLDSNDTGGAVNRAMWCSRLWALLALVS